MKGVGEREVLRLPAGERTTDQVVVEEPLEIRVADETMAVTMRTPGNDRELTLGFLFAEGVIASAADVGSVAHCGRPDQEGYGNTINVVPGAGVSLDLDKLAATRRGTLTTSACGVCGRRSVKDVQDRCRPVAPGPIVAFTMIANAINALRGYQPNFARTGGIHAAALLDESGEVLAAFEDIGRHNAVDKAVGALFLAGKLSSAAMLAVSGRASFEIIQKAAAAGVPIVASVSAASTLAIDLAKATGITLAGFVRGGAMTVYTHPERIRE